MLIKYQTSVINLDNVSEFVKTASLTIRFFFDSYDTLNSQALFSDYDFDSEEERDAAFLKIQESYEINDRICNLG